MPRHPWRKDMTNRRVQKGSVTEELERLTNRAKSRVRARVEHMFAVVKRLWGFDKVRYRGLAKNATRAFVALGLANIFAWIGLRAPVPILVDAEHGWAKWKCQNLHASAPGEIQRSAKRHGGDQVAAGDDCKQAQMVGCAEHNSPRDALPLKCAFEQ
jgi:hypothetical protein